MKTKAIRKTDRLIAVLLIAVLTVGMFPLLVGERSYAEEKETEVETDDLDVMLAEEDKNAEEAKAAPAQPDLDAIPVSTGETGGKGKKGLYLQSTEFDSPDVNNAIELLTTEVQCEVKEAGKQVTYKFIAPDDGYYTFYSKSEMDTVGRVVKLDPETNELEQIAKNDDNGDDNDFLMGFSAKEGDIFYLQAKLYLSENTGTFTVGVKKEDFNASINVSLDKATGIATVAGVAENEAFKGLYIDDDEADIDEEISGQNSFEVNIDMKQADVGLHTISAELFDHEVKVYYEYAVPTYVYDKPCNKLNFYSTGKNYISLFYSGDYYSYDDDCKIYMEYKKKGGKWSGLVGPAPVSSSTGIKKSGLKGGKTYYTRLYYGKEVEYGGATYLITGKDTAKPSVSKKMKTGKSKAPAIKSVKITKAKHVKQTVPIWISIGGGAGYWRYITSYYTTFKVTVRLKRKPGTAGIYIGTKRMRGNKKTYSTTFSQSGKLKGKVLKVAIYSYQSKTYGGYSPVKRKKAKVR